MNLFVKSFAPKMDMYGFYNSVCPYQYNQEEQQDMASSMPFSPTVNNLPVSGSTWNSRGLAWGMPSPPQLVQFTGQLPVFKEDKASPLLHCKQCKRKSLDDVPVVPTKQRITEEKMAAHLNSLHLSSDYTSHAATETMDVTMDAREGETLVEKIKGHTIMLSDEVKRIREEPILPAVLIERLEKPSMSLVVWKPRENILEQIKENESKPEEEEPKKRNGVLVDSSSDVDMWSSGPSKWNIGGNGTCM